MPPEELIAVGRIADYITPDVVVPHQDIMAALGAIGVTPEMLQRARMPMGALLGRVIAGEKPGAYRLEQHLQAGQICIYFYNALTDATNVRDWSLRVVIDSSGTISGRECGSNRLR